MKNKIQTNAEPWKTNPAILNEYVIEIVKIYEEYPSKEMKLTQESSSTSVNFLFKFLFITFLHVKKSSTYFFYFFYRQNCFPKKTLIKCLFK